MTRYSFHSILINGQQIEIDHILNKTATPLSGFEASTFAFIQKWFSTTNEFIQDTSGSTGSPKSIVITRQQMEASARLTQQALQLKPGDTALLCLDPEFIAGKMMLVRSFVSDMKIIAVNPSQNPFREIPADIRIDFTALVPSQLYELLQSTQVYRLNSVNNILVGGAPLNEHSHGLLSPYTCRLYATYGMTETVSHIALQSINGPDASTCFTLLQGIKIAADNRGCLVIEAPYLTDKITTNDLVEIIDSSHFKWLGRADNIINTGGIKIIPEKIESKIRTLLDQLKISNKVLISSLPDPKLGNKVVMLVEGDIRHLSVEDLRQHLRGILSSHEMPKEFFFHVKFVLTKNDKINRFETARQVGNWEKKFTKNGLLP